MLDWSILASFFQTLPQNIIWFFLPKATIFGKLLTHLKFIRTILSFAIKKSVYFEKKINSIKKMLILCFKNVTCNRKVTCVWENWKLLLDWLHYSFILYIIFFVVFFRLTFFVGLFVCLIKIIFAFIEKVIIFKKMLIRRCNEVWAIQLICGVI